MKYDDKGNGTLCCVCLTRKATFVFVGCGHQCLCHRCRNFMQVYKKSRTTERDPAEVGRQYQNHRGSLDMAFPCPLCRTTSKQKYDQRQTLICEVRSLSQWYDQCRCDDRTLIRMMVTRRNCTPCPSQRNATLNSLYFHMPAVSDGFLHCASWIARLRFAPWMIGSSLVKCLMSNVVG